MKLSLSDVLMLSGMLAIVFYVMHVVIGGLRWKGYSHLQQPISDLTATGAPNRNLMLTLTTIYGLLVLLFTVSFTILKSREHNPLVFWGGISFIVLHLVSVLYPIFPQDLPDTETSFRGRMHILITALIVPFTILTPFLIGFGYISEPQWHSFGVYSISTGILILVFGGTTAIFYAKKLPYFGLVERLNIGTLQVWTFVFSLELVLIK
jgi:hypothetical membrane protein